MARKRKRIIVEEKVIVKNDLIERLINKLRSLDKPNGLIIGTNAVLRRLEKRKLGIVLLSKAASYPLYISLSLHCKKGGILFVSLQDNEISRLKNKLSRITTIGVKKSAVARDKTLCSLVQAIERSQNRDLDSEPEDKESGDLSDSELEEKSDNESDHFSDINTSENPLINKSKRQIYLEKTLSDDNEDKSLKEKAFVRQPSDIDNTGTSLVNKSAEQICPDKALPGVKKDKSTNKADAFISLAEYSSSEDDEFPKYKSPNDWKKIKISRK